MDYHPYSPPVSPNVDENASLRSQALNADGTPKRPMNAFMIFARRRRPQVSAANQMMRTGEISKILSREWNTMPMADKQFYLDQAKKLKESFNQKYPDYVYRRRPNNSRKKRRTDTAPYDPDVSPHVHHDYDAAHDDAFGSVSPIDPPPHGIVHHPDMLPHYRMPGAAAAGSAAYPSAGSMHDPYPYYHPRLPPVYDTPAPTLSLSTASFPHHHHRSGSSNGGGATHHHAPQLYGSPAAAAAADDHLWHPSSTSSHHPPMKPDPWPHHHSHSSTHTHLLAEPSPAPILRLSTRRGAGPLTPLHAPSSSSSGALSLPAPQHLHGAHGTHARHWSDSTTATTTTGASASASSASPPSSAGSGRFPPGVGSQASGTNGFSTLTAPFYPAGGTTAAGAAAGTGATLGLGLGLGGGVHAAPGSLSPSTASASSVSSYFSATSDRGEGPVGGRYERADHGGGYAASTSASHHSHGHAGRSGHAARGTLALSPASVQQASQGHGGGVWHGSGRMKAEM